MTSLKVKVPYSSWFVPYGREPSVICDAKLSWFIGQLGSINGQSSTFQYFVWYWPDPYSSMSYLPLETKVIQATLTINPPPNPTLWVFGFDDPMATYFQSIPNFVYSASVKPLATTVEVRRETFNFLAMGAINPNVAFTDKPPIGADKRLGTVTRVIERYRINRIAKRYGI